MNCRHITKILLNKFMSFLVPKSSMTFLKTYFVVSLLRHLKFKIVTIILHRSNFNFINVIFKVNYLFQ